MLHMSKNKLYFKTYFIRVIFCMVVISSGWRGLSLRRLRWMVDSMMYSLVQNELRRD